MTNDALAQFKLGASLERQKSPEDIAKDEDYMKPLNTPLSLQKAKLAQSLYGIKSKDTVNEEIIKDKITPKLDNINPVIDTNLPNNDNNTALLDNNKPQLEGNNKGIYDKKVEPVKNTTVIGNNQLETSEQQTDNLVKQPEKEKLTGDKLEKVQEQKLQLDKFKENPNYPILKRFTELKGTDGGNMGVTELDDDTLLQISKILYKNPGEEGLEYLKTQLDNINFKNPNTQVTLSIYIDKVTDLNKDKQVLKNNESGKPLELPKEFKTNNILNKPDDEIVQLVAKNFTKLPDGNNGEANFNKDILTSFEITANKIIDGKNFPRNESFDRAMKDVKTSEKIETRLAALSYINSLVNTAEGLKGAGSVASYDKIIGEHNLKKQEYIDFQIGKLNEELIQAQNKSETKKIQSISEEINKLEDEKTKGDVFEAGKIDKVTEAPKNLGEAKA